MVHFPTRAEKCGHLGMSPRVLQESFQWRHGEVIIIQPDVWTFPDRSRLSTAFKVSLVPASTP